MEDINEYLNKEERSYQDGVTLLSRYCKNRMLVNTLSRSESLAHKHKLEYELKKLLQAQPKGEYKTIAIKKPATEPVKTEIKAKPTSEDQEAGFAAPGANAEYDNYIAERSRLHSERCKLSNTLADAQTDEERQEIVDKIEAIERSRKAIATKLKYFDEHGAFPEAPVAPEQPLLSELDKAELLKKRNNLRSQVSKAKKAVEKKPSDVAKQEKLAKLEVELNSVELQLKQANEQESAAI